MPARLYLPGPVKESIRKHITSATALAMQGVDSAWADEDTITGHVLRGFQARKRSVQVDGSNWEWSIDYKKLGGRGAHALEKRTGADGIVELVVRDVEGTRQKTALFQAKKDSLQDSRLLKQCVDLSTWREAAFVMLFQRDGFHAFRLDDVIGTRRGRLPQPPEGEALDEFLGRTFLDCFVGDRDLRYDRERERLEWRDSHGQQVAMAWRPRQALSIEASQLRGKLVEDPRDHRMSTDSRGILGLEGSFTRMDVRRAARRAMLIYHPDGAPEDLQTPLEKRVKEINEAYESLVAEAEPDPDPGESSPRVLDAQHVSLTDILSKAFPEGVSGVTRSASGRRRKKTGPGPNPDGFPAPAITPRKRGQKHDP